MKGFLDTSVLVPVFYGDPVHDEWEHPPHFRKEPVCNLLSRHECPWEIRFGDPRSQRRDLGHPSWFSCEVGGEADFSKGSSPYLSTTGALLVLELPASEYGGDGGHQLGKRFG